MGRKLLSRLTLHPKQEKTFKLFQSKLIKHDLINKSLYSIDEFQECSDI